MRLSLSSRDLVLVALALGIGWWAQRPAPAVVHADSEHGATEASFFQFSNAAGEGTLSLYSASDHTIYVYGGALSGNSKKQCTYAIKLGRAGAPLDRVNCPIGSLF